MQIQFWTIEAAIKDLWIRRRTSTLLCAAMLKRRRRPTRHRTGFPEGAATSSRWSQHATRAGYHRRRRPAPSLCGEDPDRRPTTTAGGDLLARHRPRRGCAWGALADRPGLPACGGRFRRSGLPVATWRCVGAPQRIRARRPARSHTCRGGCARPGRGRVVRRPCRGRGRRVRGRGRRMRRPCRGPGRRVRRSCRGRGRVVRRPSFSAGRPGSAGALPHVTQALGVAPLQAPVTMPRSLV